MPQYSSIKVSVTNTTESSIQIIFLKQFACWLQVIKSNDQIFIINTDEDPSLRIEKALRQEIYVVSPQNYTLNDQITQPIRAL